MATEPSSSRGVGVSITDSSCLAADVADGLCFVAALMANPAMGSCQSAGLFYSIISEKTHLQVPHPVRFLGALTRGLLDFCIRMSAIVLGGCWRCLQKFTHQRIRLCL